MSLKNIPADMALARRWLARRADKAPINPHTGHLADVTDPANYSSMAEAIAGAVHYNLSGIGFALGDGWVGVDLDHCAPQGKILPWVWAIVERLQTYSEYSPSGEGVHIIGRGALPAGGRRRERIEMYDAGRYFTVTGRILPGYSHIRECQAEIDALHRMLFPPRAAVPTPPPQPQVSDLTDAELIERAHLARNGTKFAALWRGDTTGYESASHADLALSSMLAYWCGNDPQRVDRLFRQSGLWRGKWDRRAYSDGRTYGQATIQRAVGHG